MRWILAYVLCAAAARAQSPDLVVYGGTASGAITAVSGARQGLKVTLLEPGRHIGGMVSGGLSRTDVGRREVIGGYALEFYWRAGLAYQLPQHLQDIAWLPEPHVAEAVLGRMLQDAGVTVILNSRLREKDGVRKSGVRLLAITMENGTTYSARMFADCSYEGDLMAQAGVTFTWGREGSADYGESLAGVRDETPYHQFKVDLRAPGGLDLADKPGAADRKVQAYNFRMILSHDRANQAPYPRPERYDAARYELLARYLNAMETQQRRPLKFGELTSLMPIPNQKVDLNNNGPFSTDYIGGSWEYPNGSYARRAQIWKDHEEYTKGFFWFLTHDPRVPASLRREAEEWGLARDEFADNGHFPPQLYIREARRMVGAYVMSQKDIQTELTKPDVIGMGSYNSDSHNVQRVVNRDGFVRNEGDMQVSVKPYQIPYRMIVPKKTEMENLLVPVCFSATHVAYSTLRMEPQYMIIGQAAGVAAAMAIAKNAAVQDIDTGRLKQTLLEHGAIFELQENPQAAVVSRFKGKWPPGSR